jgi:leucyl-tRNA synthetase
MGKAGDVLRIIHRTIAEISRDYERFHFNRAVAHARELSNALDELDGTGSADAWVLRQGLETLVRVVNPMLPHVSEELWARLGHATLLCETPWPKADPGMLVDNTVTVAVQVNGKLRATISLPRDASKDDAEAAALADANVQRALGGNAPKKVIVVANKIVNIVV